MSRNLLARWLLPVASTAVFGYVVAAFFYGGRVAGIRIGGPAVACLLAVWIGASSVLTHFVSEQRRRDILAACLSLLFAFVVVDTAYTVSINSQASGGSSRADELSNDSHLWLGELNPRLYYPTDRSFQLYKPNVRLEGSVYGGFYEQPMLESPTLVAQVLRLKSLVYMIDANGLRNRVPIEESRLWALGDSFVFGWAVTEGRTWTDRFRDLTGQPIYNLGVSGTGPAQEVQLLEHLLRNGKDAVRPTRLLWMLFEGNDLENSYDERRRSSNRALADDTFVADLLSLPSTVHRRSVIGRLLDGEVRLEWPGAARRDDPYKIDGVPLSTPVYHSQLWGYCIFNPDDIRATTRGEGYVESHPNRRRLDRAFERMKALSDEFGFRVAVMVAPTMVRLHGRDFPTMPQPSAAPYFIRYVESLAERSGFETFDLLGALGSKDWGVMLYYCDDNHWNERGNEAVARVLAQRFER